MGIDMTGFAFPKPTPRVLAKRAIKPRATCQICGKKAPIPSQKSCSAKCAYLLRKLRTRSLKTCSVCGVEYFPSLRLGRGKYCSLRCYNTVRTGAAFVTLTCEHCGKTFQRRQVRTRPQAHVFCSKECFGGFNVGERNHWYRGGSDPNRGASWLKVAASIRERDGYCCRRCGKSQAENGRRLDVDHIRPWRLFHSAAEANNPTNLVALCGACHKSKTAGAERAWLRGDVLAMQQYERAVNLPSAVRG
jgi:predicted nucleic acid-binding Zn ribbon protein